jgi:hypothetical protein
MKQRVIAKSLVVTVLCGLLLVTEQQIAIPQAEQPQRPTSTPLHGRPVDLRETRAR